MYQPLKGAAGNSRPPISSSMLDTAGRAYQRRPRAANHSSLRAPACGQVSREALPARHPHGSPLSHLTRSPSCSRGVLQGHLED